MDKVFVESRGEARGKFKGGPKFNRPRLPDGGIYECLTQRLDLVKKWDVAVLLLPGHATGREFA